MKSLSVCFLMLSHRVFIDHSELVLMWSLALLGVSFSAMWIVRSSAVLFDWMIFFPTGVLVFLGSFGPNHTPIPAFAFLSPFRLQDLSVYTMLSGALWVLVSHLASRLCLVGFVKIQKFL